MIPPFSNSLEQIVAEALDGPPWRGWLFLRGFAIVACTAANVRLIARGLYGWAFLTGFLISAIWWSNAGRASDDRRITSLLIYATGAAAGTVTGMWIGGLL